MLRKHTKGQTSNPIGLYRDEKVHIWGGIGIVVCHCHPKYELFSPEIDVVGLCQAKNKNRVYAETTVLHNTNTPRFTSRSIQITQTQNKTRQNYYAIIIGCCFVNFIDITP